MSTVRKILILKSQAMKWVQDSQIDVIEDKKAGIRRSYKGKKTQGWGRLYARKKKVVKENVEGKAGCVVQKEEVGWKMKFVIEYI